MARSSKPTFARIILFRCVISGLRARDGFTANVTRVTRQALDPALTRSKFQRDPERPRPLDSSARARAQRIESGQGLPHDPPAALDAGEQALSEVLEIASTVLSAPILSIRSRPSSKLVTTRSTWSSSPYY